MPTGYINDPQTILDVERLDPQGHENLSFTITQIGSDHFQESRNRRKLPIKRLALQGSEELLITKAKRRPCVVLSSCVVGDASKISDSTQQRLARKSVGKTLYLVAPCYSVSTMQEPGTFGPELVARIRALQYPHLYCLPHKRYPNRPGSIVRLDHLFSTYLGRGCNPWDYRLSDDALEVLLSATSMVLGTSGRELFDSMRELIVETGLPIEDAQGAS